MISDRGGIPLVVLSTPANVPDQEVFLAMLDSMPPVKMPMGGRPAYKPEAAVGDRAYGTKHLIAEVVKRRIESLLAPRNSEHGSGLGVIRYVIERTMSWIGNYRRLKLCYERKGEHWQAFNELAACLICANRIEAVREEGRIAA